MAAEEEGGSPKWGLKVPIFASLCLVLFLYTTAVCNVVLPWYSYSVHGVTHLLALSATTGLGLFCYCACCLVDPGQVPAGWQPELEQPSILEVKRSGEHRFCCKCNAYKPPRAHHCRQCKRCITRMDHHCVWVNSCIGHGNARAFILMCLYLAAAAVHATYLLYRYDLYLLALLWSPNASAGGSRLAAAGAAADTEAADAWWGSGAGPDTAGAARWWAPFWLHATAQVAASALALPITLALLILLIWNVMLLLRNMTTIEHHEGVRLQLLAAGGPGDRSGAAGAVAAAGVRDGHALKLSPSAAVLAALASEAPAPAPGGTLSGMPRPASWQQLAQASTAASAQQMQQAKQGGQAQQQPQQAQQQKPVASAAVLKYKGVDQHPYDLGWHANLEAVFGDGWELLWFLPLRFAASGDGLSFQTRSDVRRRRQQKGPGPI